MNWKDKLKLTGMMGGLVGGGVLGVLLLVALSIVATAGPVVLVMWVAYKLFF